MSRHKSSEKEETLKAQVFETYFGTVLFLYRPNIDNIDFVVMDKAGRHLIWAEVKRSPADIIIMFAQLILTIGRAKTYNKIMPPKFLAVFDSEKIAFLPYAVVSDIFYQNDFNWNVRPSDTGTKEFAQIKKLIEETIQKEKLLYYFETENALLKEYIKNNIAKQTELFSDLNIRARVDKTNFTHVYRQWTFFVKPSIQIDWEAAKRHEILDADFYLADLISEDDITIKDKLFVLLQKNKYELDRQIGDMGLFSSKSVEFKDKGAAHKEFWAKYVRPPREEFWDYIVERRDLLISQDVRERKGAFFTPPQWVAKAHEYLAKIFGDDWQDEYYIWDNSAGTGNLLAGLVNKNNIWASTLDKQDVQVMHDRIENGANMWDDNVFQFDFLNDDIKPLRDGGKMPNQLYDIIADAEKRQKLIILMNPPYGEAGNARTRTSKGTKHEVKHKAGVQESKTKERFKSALGKSLTEKYVQFFVRILYDIPDCKMAAFVKAKYICGGSMKKFRKVWEAEYLGGFATPSMTHDNCTGKYPICLFVWDLAQKKNFPKSVRCDVFNEKERREGVKKFYAPRRKTINDWMREYNLGKENSIGMGRVPAPDFQRNTYCWIGKESIKDHGLHLNEKNLLPFMVYFSARHCIEHKWINDADQYFYPKDTWQEDIEFQNDCIVFTLFHSYNKIKSKEGVNHWIPFSEAEVGLTRRFESNFMKKFLDNRGIGSRESGVGFQNTGKLPASNSRPPTPSSAVLAAGLELWRYYIQKTKTDANASINASFYDIREYFQAGASGGKMGVSSNDETYNALLAALRAAQKTLAAKIEPKVYEYGFLKE